MPASVALAPEPAVAVSRIEGGTLLEGGYLSQSGSAGVKVFFSEGSTFALTPGTRGRLRSVAEDGAHLAVENGTASLEITQSRGHRWLVEAGPFLVTVKGTVFTVSWDPASERFELRLRHGHVVVSGPVVERTASRCCAGQRLVVSLPRAETVITEEPPEEAAALPPTRRRRRHRVRGATGDRERSAADPRRRRRPSSSSWPRARARAAGPPIWRAGTGIASSRTSIGTASTRRSRTPPARTCSPSPTRPGIGGARSWLARRCWRSVVVFRARRARSTRSSCSGGRRSCVNTEPRAQAIDWYDEYLAQAPTGAYAAEALGRKMILTNEAGGPAQARPIAGEYLLRFPTGSYAGSARALQRAP